MLGAEGLEIFLRSGKSEGTLIHLRVALRRTRGAGVRVGGKKRKSITPGLTLSVCFGFWGGLIRVATEFSDTESSHLSHTTK